MCVKENLQWRRRRRTECNNCPFRERDRDNYVCYKYSFKLNIYIFFGNISILLFIIKIYSQTLFNHSHKHCMHTRYKECRNLSHFARKIIFFFISLFMLVRCSLEKFKVKCGVIQSALDIMRQELNEFLLCTSPTHFTPLLVYLLANEY